jgi:hypothetical protein
VSKVSVGHLACLREKLNKINGTAAGFAYEFSDWKLLNRSQRASLISRCSKISLVHDEIVSAIELFAKYINEVK